MSNHCSFSLLKFTFLLGHRPWVDAQLSICTGTFAFGEGSWIDYKDALYDLTSVVLAQDNEMVDGDNYLCKRR